MSEDSGVGATLPNRRRHERYDLFAQVRVQSGKTDYVFELVNISASGALLSLGKVRKPTWLLIGRSVEIGIIQPETGDLVALAGSIVRVQDAGTGLAFAVEFEPPSDAAQEGLRSLLALARRAPPPLPRGPGPSAGS